jgi:hypothetical protein
MALYSWFNRKKFDFTLTFETKTIKIKDERETSNNYRPAWLKTSVNGSVGKPPT